MGRRRVPADVRKDFRESALQTFPDRMCRIAIQSRHIRLLKSDAATRPRQPNGFLQELFRIANRASHKARVHQIEAPGWKSRVVDIARYVFDVRETARVRVLASMVEKDSICVETDDSPVRANAHAEKIRYPARTPAQVQAVQSRPHTNAVQHNRCVRSKRVTLDMQPLNLAGTPLDRVMTLR